jgi:hypothetical protein
MMQSDKLEMGWFCIRRQGKAGNFGAQFMEPKSQPGTLEARMTGDEHGFVFEEIIKHC